MTYICRLVYGLGLLFAVQITVGQTAVRDANITFTTIDVPGAGVTAVQGINSAGDVVGVYGKTNTSPAHAFVLRDGTLTRFTYPGQRSTFAMGINDSGLIVGYAGDVVVRGFVYDGTTYSLMNEGDATATFSMGINNAGDVVGGAGTIYVTQGFERHKGHFKKVSPPGSFVYVYDTAINNFGVVVGWTDESAFVYDHGDFQTVAFPGAGQTQAHGINDQGMVVGWYVISGGCACGFVMKNGRYISFGFPGAKGTFPYGINASGQVVGSYTLDYATYHGFVTSPVTDASIDFQGSADLAHSKILTALPGAAE